jgi:hypothetical protein
MALLLSTVLAFCEAYFTVFLDISFSPFLIRSPFLSFLSPMEIKNGDQNQPACMALWADSQGKNNRSSKYWTLWYNGAGNASGDQKNHYC